MQTSDWRRSSHDDGLDAFSRMHLVEIKSVSSLRGGSDSALYSALCALTKSGGGVNLRMPAIILANTIEMRDCKRENKKLRLAFFV